jgi:hypothetical protein
VARSSTSLDVSNAIGEAHRREILDTLLGGEKAEHVRRFEGWPDADAVETVELHETDGVTTLSTRLAFRDQAGRDHMTRNDGQEDSYNKLEDYLRSVLEQRETASAG